MDKRSVVAALEVNLRLFADPVLDDNVQPVTLADRGDSSMCAIRNQLIKLMLRGECQFLAECRLKPPEPDAPGGWQDGEEIAVATAQHDGFGQRASRDVASSGGRDR
jgi:hypothetical protein